MSANSTRRKFFRSCLCCEPSCLPASPARRQFPGRRCGCAGPGTLRDDRPRSHPAAAQAPAAKPRIDVHHHFIPQFHVDSMMAPGRRAGAPPAEMVAGAVARGHGQERDRDLDPVDRPARHLVRQQCRGVPQPRAPAQRVRRQDREGPSRPLRPLCRDRAAGRATAASRRSNMPSTRSRPTASGC